MDNSKEGLMHLNKKLSISSSFGPISEKQEEISISSTQGKKQIKKKNSLKNSKIKITKDVLDDTDNFIRHCKTQKNKKSFVGKNQTKILSEIKEENKNEPFENSFTRILKKKRNKRISQPEQRFPISSIRLNNHLNNSEIKERNKIKKGSLGKQGNNFLNIISNSYLMHNNSSNIQEISHSKQYSNNKSLSNGLLFEKQYIKKLDNNKTTLHKGLLNFNKKNETSVFDQIKNSKSYEKSENLLFKMKICYAILSIFSLLSIILNCSDAIIYNGKSLDYLHRKYNYTYIQYKNNIESYYCINNRKISSKENNIRICNGIFSIICTLIIIIIYYIRNNSIEKKNYKKEYLKKMFNKFYSRQRKKYLDKNKTKSEEDRIKNQKIIVVDFNQEKDLKDEESTIYDKNITIIICILNIIFYPPYVNKAFIGQYNQIIYIYSLNSIFLIISLIKISNIYKALFYFSSINNSFNKAICKSNLIILNFSFMFKYGLNRFPLRFLFLNLIIVLISLCIVTYCIEFFSLDINEDFLNNIIENKRENFFNIISYYFFFIIRNIPEDHNIKSIFGKLVIYIGGIIGMIFSSYLIYYINDKIEFTQEEQESYSKLSKLLDPINKEHKSSNVIKSLLMLKKVLRDNQNTEKDYRLKMEDLKRHTFNQRKPIFQKENNFHLIFNSESNNNLININEQNQNEEKKKFLKYIGSHFFHKIKFIIEMKNCSDNLKIARNSTLSLNDALKSLGNKMDANIAQLNNKLEVLIKTDQVFLNYIKFTFNTIKRIKKINDYNKSLIQYFSEVHNEHVKQMIEIRKEVEINSIFTVRNSKVFRKKMKSNYFGNFNFNHKRIKNKIVNDFNNKHKLKRGMHEIIKKQKSSVFCSKLKKNYILDDKLKQLKSKQNTNKSRNKQYPQSSKSVTSNKNKRTSSFDNEKFLKKKLKDKNKGRNIAFGKVRRSNSVLNREKKDNP